MKIRLITVRQYRRQWREGQSGECGGVWGRVSCPQPTGGLGSVVSSPSGVRSRASAANAFPAYSRSQNANCIKKNHFQLRRRAIASDCSPWVRHLQKSENRWEHAGTTLSYGKRRLNGCENVRHEWLINAVMLQRVIQQTNRECRTIKIAGISTNFINAVIYKC